MNWVGAGLVVLKKGRIDVKIKFKEILLVIFISLFLAGNVFAKTDIMSVDELKVGMKGIGKTVLQGTRIEEFNVEILSILKNQQPNQDLILVKTSGDVIERTGGIASGMSGSPVYVNDKLIGAIGYGWQLADHKIGMVTPINSMLDIFSLDYKADDTKEIELSTPIKIGNRKYDKICFTKSIKKIKGDNILTAIPVTTPLLVNGITGRAREELAEGLKDYNLIPVDGGGVADLEDDISLQPGSAVAVQLVRGDINVSSIGTLTYRDHNKVLAFGHPFLAKGDVNYLLSSAYIHQMITSIKMPFKLGSPAQLKGIINQDRTAGVAGKIGIFPNVVPVEVNVTDKDLERTKRYEVQIVQNEDLMEELASSVILQAIDSTIDRKGAGTAKVNIEIMGNKLPSNIIKLENLYYSPNDIAAVSLTDFLYGVDLVLHNPFFKINLADIKFNVEIEKETQVALIKEIKLNKEEVNPGEEVEAQIIIKPYRKEEIERRIKFKVPKEVNGKVEVCALSGQESNFNQSPPQEEQNKSKTNTVKSLDELIKLYKEKKNNNQLVLQLKQIYSGHKELEEIEESEKEIDQGDDLLLEKEIDLNYFLEGSVMEELKIITSEDE